MLNSETKRHIDAARQVLVGVVPDPRSQIDQITNALIYKFMDDMDQAAIREGGEPAFFTGDLEKYAWTKLMDSRIGNQARMNLYDEALLKFSTAKQLPELFRSIFKSAFLPYRSPEVLNLFLKEINNFDYSHPEELGNAYEYLLSVMSSQGDAGQFRTPRHIIDFIVKVVDPKKDDKILDPACGTAGFLISAYKHILSQHDGKGEDGKINDEKPLTPDERRTLSENFEGYDIDPGMVRIAQVNMYLHQFKNPKIFQYDSLSSEERWKDKFDVILANPPFMSPKGGVRPHQKFTIQSNRSEVLFVDYIMNHLRPRGRAGVIVPEGIIFQSASAHKKLRKNLVEDGLYAVVSLPSGVFNPYAGVKTSILFFDNEISKRSQDILFIKIEQDGYDLGAQRRPISENDLPQALEELSAYKKYIIEGITSTTFTDRIKRENTEESQVIQHDKFILAKKSLIAKNGDYNLSGDRYRVATDYTNAKWPMVELGHVCNILNGSTPKRAIAEYWENGTIPWFTIDDLRSQGQNIYITKQKITEKGFRESSVKLLPKQSTLLCCTASIGECAYTQIELTTNQQFNGLVVKENFKNKLNPKYLFWCVSSFKDELERISGKATFGFVSIGTLKNFKIPLPPLEIQEQIVEELDGYQKIIAGAKQIVENWKPKIDIDPEWEKVKLGDIAEVKAGQSPEGKYYNDKGLGTPFYQGKTEFGNIYIGAPKKWTTQVTKLAESGDILMSVRAPVGPVNITQDKICIGRGLAGIRAKKIEQMFLFTYLQMIEKQIIGNGGAVFDSISKKQIEEIKVILPNQEIQKQIIEKIEVERDLVDSAKKLIWIYEGKMKKVIDKVWEE